MVPVLVVEDDPEIGASLRALLHSEGMEPVLATTLRAAKELFQKREFALLVVDVNLPDGSGFDFVRDVRDRDGSLPVVFLTARLDEESALKGLALGASDYLRKPFGSRELVLRLRRLLGGTRPLLQVGELVADMRKREIRWKSRPIALSPREIDLLTLLMEHVGEHQSREQLLDRLDAEGNLFDRSINTYVSRLRTKLEAAGVEGIEITSVYGSGYRLDRK